MALSDSHSMKERTASQRHWVEELFPPHFTLSIADLSKKPQVADEGTQEAWRMSQRKKVRDIYHEVKARLDSEAQIPKDKNIQVGEPVAESRHNVQLKGQVRRLETSRGSEGSKECRSIQMSNDSTLWSAGEIAILRDEFQKVKEEKQIIHIQLKALQQDYRELREKYDQNSKDLNATVNQFKQSRQECKRLALQSEHLAKDVRLQKSKLAMAEDDYREVVEQRLSMRKEMIELRKSHAQARQEIKELKIRLSEVDTKHRLELMEREESMKLEYESQIAQLYQELGEARTKLEKEQTEHRRSHKALDLLRIHFAHQSSSSEPKGDSASSESKTLKVLQLY